MNDASQARRLFRPDFGLLLPPNWVARASVELISAELEAHVLVTLDDLGEHAVLDDYAARYGSMLAEKTPNYQELRRENVQLSAGRAAVVRHFRWQPDGGGPVEQLQAYILEGRRGIAATLLTPRPLAELEPTFLDVLGGITTSSPSAGGLVRLEDDPRSRTFDALERGELAAPRGVGDASGSAPDSGRWRDLRTAWEAAAEGVSSP